MAKGKLYVISAPSGAGKSTLIGRVRALCPNLVYSISCTTRPPRDGEVHGIHYYFLEKSEFQGMIRTGQFLEWKEVHGNLYGTPAPPVTSAMLSGKGVILDIDVQGAAEVFERFPHAVGIFIAPPDMEVLEERLRSRGTDSEHSIRVRLANARQEMAKASKFDYVVVNNDLEHAVQDLAEIIRGESETNRTS